MSLGLMPALSLWLSFAQMPSQRFAHRAFAFAFPVSPFFWFPVFEFRPLLRSSGSYQYQFLSVSKFIFVFMMPFVSNAQH